MREEFLINLLEEKEARARKQSLLLESFPKTLLSIGLNIPGEQKNSKEIRAFFQKSIEQIEKELHRESYPILYRELEDKETGNHAFLVVDTESSWEIKKMFVAWEERNLSGRILDIDVLDRRGKILSRGDLGLAARRCLLCEKEAIFCIKNQSHSYEDLYRKAMEYITMGG